MLLRSDPGREILPEHLARAVGADKVERRLVCRQDKAVGAEAQKADRWVVEHAAQQRGLDRGLDSLRQHEVGKPLKLGYRLIPSAPTAEKPASSGLYRLSDAMSTWLTDPQREPHFVLKRGPGLRTLCGLFERSLSRSDRVGAALSLSAWHRAC